MALWTKAQQLQGDALLQVKEVYGDHFPIEVRHFLAHWIEEKPWSDVDPQNPQHVEYATSILLSLVQELESTANNLNHEPEHFLSKMKLIDAANNLRQRYSQDPVSLLAVIHRCLSTEARLVQQAESMGMDVVTMSSSATEIDHLLTLLHGRTHSTMEDLRRMDHEQESVALLCHESTKLGSHLTHLQPGPQTRELESKLRSQKEMVDQQLSHKYNNVKQIRASLIEKLKATISSIAAVQNKILDEELIKWKRDQQLAGNGAKFNNNLDTIQAWCERLAQVNWLSRQQIKEAERLKKSCVNLDNQNVPDILPQLNAQITQLLSSLVTSTFVIEKQPPQVMKTNTRFTSTIRLLVGGQLNVHMNPPQVKVAIISEAQANVLLKNEAKAKGDSSSGEILNNIGTMEYHATNKQLSISFRNMQLKKIKRAEKKGTESVMDEKFSLLFSSSFSVGGGELVFQVWTLSFPVVVIVHGNQEPHAWATVTWDNAFAEPGRVPFTVPEKVPWPLVAEALSVKFASHTGRPLSDEQLQFLAEKAFRSNQAQHQDFSNAHLSWAQFCKEPLPERSFTFWEWFYAVMKLTRDHLKGPWCEGFIHGFLRKKQAEEMLSTCPNGTFLLRFSDSELGGLTIACVGLSEDSKHAEVFMLHPFTSKDFAIRGLADRISDLENLLYLYPDISKVQAFGRYFTAPTESQPMANGYVKTFLRTQIPGGAPGNSQPSTPQNMFQPQSPDTGSVSSYPYHTGEADCNELLSSIEFDLSFSGEIPQF